MAAQTSKKLSLKKETLRVLEGSDKPMLEGAVGGTSTYITVGTTSTVTISIMGTIASGEH